MRSVFRHHVATPSPACILVQNGQLYLLAVASLQQAVPAEATGVDLTK